MTDPTAKLRSALERSLKRLERVRSESSHTPETIAIADKLELLHRTLSDALGALETGRPLDHPALGGLVRWTLDWIHDLDDPVIAALEDVERHARAIR